MSGTPPPPPSEQSQQQDEDKKPNDQSAAAHINLKVKGQSVEFNSIAFLFDGRRLRADQTPDELEMEDGDEIDAMLHQTGGGLEGWCPC
ncbi:hypothetical protein AQUCO_10800045v1 [Aquilegia coerulea]|uniref:Ubiquitin-like domain-containing protein n=1 Tax=Aquilegia coerulea TaxID=218851 RepID=A0A2G5C3F1_AQUCA|nr:hypothetical protein AQUCO_10800045v1 [Aquilegia coerulea]